MQTDRVSYCYLFLGLVLASQAQHSVTQVLRVLPLSPHVQQLAAAFSART